MGRAPETSIIASGIAVLDGLGWGKQEREASIMSISRSCFGPFELGQAPEASIMSISRSCFGPFGPGQALEASIMSISRSCFWTVRASTRSEHHEHQPQLFWTVRASTRSEHHEHQPRLLWTVRARASIRSGWFGRVGLSEASIMNINHGCFGPLGLGQAPGATIMNAEPIGFSISLNLKTPPQTSERIRLSPEPHVQSTKGNLERYFSMAACQKS